MNSIEGATKKSYHKSLLKFKSDRVLICVDPTVREEKVEGPNQGRAEEDLNHD